MTISQLLALAQTIVGIAICVFVVSIYADRLKIKKILWQYKDLIKRSEFKP